jgi:hypothetical protein
MLKRLVPLALACCLSAPAAWAACINRFVNHSERPHQVITLLTGKLTFQEAQLLAKAINAKEAPPLEWVDEAGKSVSQQFGPLKVSRPMPVGCDGRPSGVVVIATFRTLKVPSKSIRVKIKDEVIVFEEQGN